MSTPDLIAQKLFIQWLLAERLAKEEAAIEFSKNIFNRDDFTRADLIIVIGDVRELLRPFGIDLRHTYSFELDCHILGFCNTNGDAISQMATTYAAEEIEYFKTVLKSIADTPTYASSTVDLLNQSPLSKKRCEEILGSLVNNYWLVLRGNGKLGIGPRSSMELEEYFRSEELFEDCVICNAIVTSSVPTNLLTLL